MAATKICNRATVSHYGAMPRPSKFDPHITAKIIAAIHGGSTITAACKLVGARRTTFVGHAIRHGFAHIVEQAKRAGETRPSSKRGAVCSVVTAADPTVEPSEQLSTERPYSIEPRITGHCNWSASINDAGLALLVKVADAAIGSLRADLRRRGYDC